MLMAAGVMLASAMRKPAPERSFWVLMAMGFSLWACNQAAWAHSELVLHQPIPDPYFFDIVLFFHAVPMIAAVGWRPDLVKKEGKIHLGLLNFLMLVGWWIFLYAFIVFPHQYVVLNVASYDKSLRPALSAARMSCWWRCWGWRLGPVPVDGGALYLNFLGAGLLYGIGSQFLDRAVANGTYYSGSLYDAPLTGSVAVDGGHCSVCAPQWELKSASSAWTRAGGNWFLGSPCWPYSRCPCLGVWTVLFDQVLRSGTSFRIFSVLVCDVVVGSVRVPAAVSAGPGADEPAAGFAPRI